MSASALSLSAEVAAALREGRPVVALESTLVAHGLPFPQNLEAAQRSEAAVRAGGAVPATVAVLGGRVVVGLVAGELERLARSGPDVPKLSRRDLGVAVASGGDGATTVAGTIACAARAGIRVMATGGLGGVHRGGELSLDISADLGELARTPVAVVCSGAKSVLDLPRTLEVLETLGVPVVGFGCDELPAFYCRSSGLPLRHRLDRPEQVARLLQAHRELGLEGGLVVAVPVPAPAALEPDEVEAAIAEGLRRADAQGVTGPEVTPFLLRCLRELTAGRCLTANVALVEENARVAGEISAALSLQP
jgi:pseudouridylate synthase